MCSDSFELVDHYPYNLEFTPSHFSVPQHDGKQYRTDDDVISAVQVVKMRTSIPLKEVYLGTSMVMW